MLLELQKEYSQEERKKRPLPYVRVKLTEKDILVFYVNGSVGLIDSKGNRASIKNDEFIIKSSGKKPDEFDYYAIVLISSDKSEVESIKDALRKEGYALRVKATGPGRLKKTYILYAGPFKSKKELYRNAPGSVVKVEEVSGKNVEVPVFIINHGRQYTMYGKITLYVKGELLLKKVTYSRGLSSEFKKDVKIVHQSFIIPGRSGKLILVEKVPVEEYLMSVVKSEIGEYAPLEAMKAQAVAARTNVIRRLVLNQGFSDYDITSDVYSQVYQGSGNFSLSVFKAVKETRGEILLYKGEPIEALFHAMCGGHTENSENVWSSYLPYLRGVLDKGKGHRKFSFKDDNAVKRWIDSNPAVNCKKYGRKYWRWSFSYTPSELGKIVKMKLGKDIGNVIGIRVLERGVSGRAKKIRITGTKGNVIVRKDLNIRKALSYTSLPSSLFYIKKQRGKIIIIGRGFGHGVGMCQIGAMGMADKGYNYKEILKHYYSHVRVEKIY